METAPNFANEIMSAIEISMKKAPVEVASSIDDFEQTILQQASSAISRIKSNRESEALEIDVASVAASIAERAKSETIVRAIGRPVEKEKKEKKERVAREKKERVAGPIGMQSSKYGEILIRENKEIFQFDAIKLEDNKWRISSNNMSFIKEQLRNLKAETKAKAFHVFMDVEYFYTQYHKVKNPTGKPLPVESVGRTFINLIRLDGVKWSILPERQDESFSLIVDVVI